MEYVSENTTQEIAERPLEVITAEINFYKATAGAAVLEIGKRLIEAKAQLEHGEWLSWLSEKVEFSETSAQRFMRLANEYTNPSPVTDFGVSKALILLAIPENEREEFLEEKHTVNGAEKTVSEMSKRELERVIKERDEAMKVAAEKEAAISDLQEALENQKEAISKLEEEKEGLEAELNELSEKPVEAATSLSEEEKAQIIANARKELEEEREKLLKKIEKVTADKQKEAEKAEKIKQELEGVKKSQATLSEESNKKIQALADENAKLTKQLEISSSTALTEFKLHFKTVQTSINNMLGICDSAADEEKATMYKAIAGLCTAVLEKCGVGK